jgi:branched-chain amino acid transport system permease protein
MSTAQMAAKRIRLPSSAAWILSLVVVLALAALPLVASGYPIRLATTILMYAALAQALNIIAGLAGYAAFGNIVFFGLGAYGAGVGMVKAGLPFHVAALAAAAISALYAALVGLPVLRLRGHYFAIASLGVNEATRELVVNWSDFTGGGKGLALPILNLGDVALTFAFFYYHMLVLALIAVAVTWAVRRSRFGYALRTIRADEEAAAVVGVNTTLYKILAWSISAFLSSLVGSVYAYWHTFIEAPNVFDVVIVVELFVMMLLGGAGTVLGPAVGAVAVKALSEFAWSSFLEYHLAVLGVLIILIVVFLPRGLLGLPKYGPDWQYIRRVITTGRI